MRSTRTFAALLTGLLATLAFAASAHAARSQTTIFDATNDLLRADSVQARNGILDQLDALGVDTIRIVVPWRRIVPAPGAATPPAGYDPTDPAEFTGGEIATIDHAVRGAAARGMRVLLTPSAPMPNWASSSGRSALAYPKPGEYMKLLTGLGRRYDGTFGEVPCIEPPPPPAPLPPLPPICVPLVPLVPPIPRVDFWSFYNEPNLELFLKPQRRRGKPVAGAIYRSLFLAGRRGLEASGHGADTMLIGETAPGPGRTGTAPIDFLRHVLCLDGSFRRRSSCAPLQASGWAHHPYDPRGTPFSSSSSKLIGVPAIARMTTALARASSSRATRGRLPVYVTEYGVESFPDRVLGVSLQQQAEFIGLTEYLLWLNPQVMSFAQYLLSDDDPRHSTSFQSGLRRHGGGAKPSYSAFPITLAVRRLPSGRLFFWGHVRPVAESVEVQIRDQGLRLVRRVRTSPAGYFSFRAAARGGKRWSASSTLPGGRTLQGPRVRAYGF